MSSVLLFVICIYGTCTLIRHSIFLQLPTITTKYIKNVSLTPSKMFDPQPLPRPG